MEPDPVLVSKTREWVFRAKEDLDNAQNDLMATPPFIRDTRACADIRPPHPQKATIFHYELRRVPKTQSNLARRHTSAPVGHSGNQIVSGASRAQPPGAALSRSGSERPALPASRRARSGPLRRNRANFNYTLGRGNRGGTVSCHRPRVTYEIKTMRTMIEIQTHWNG